MGTAACPGVELQDVHEAYQILLKVVRSRKTPETWSKGKQEETKKKKKSQNFKKA